MKIYYKKRRRIIIGVLCLCYFTIGLFAFFNKEEHRLFDYFTVFSYIAISSIFLIEQVLQPYITIDNSSLKIYTIFKKTIYFKEITSLKKFAGDCIIKTSKASTEINTKLIDPKSLDLLNTQLDKLNIEWQ